MHNNKKTEHTPFVRIVRRPTISQGKIWGIRGAALLFALLTGALLILCLGHNPLQVYGEMLNGAVGSATAAKETVKLTIPLLVTSLAVAISFRMKFWNIGAEGQILAGGICATYFALFFADKMPSFLLLIVMAVAAMVGGGIWGAIPAIFKAKWNTNETLFTLMLNYIALGIVKYLQAGPWIKMEGGYPKIAMFDAAARLPEVFGVHIGWIFALLLVAFCIVYMNRTKYGYEITVVGSSVQTARYSGMSVPKIIIRTMLLAGAMAGFVGFLQVSGADYTLHESTAGGVGFTAITVAWLSQLKPAIMIVVAFFISLLEKGAGRIQTTFGIPDAASDVLIGIILFFMLGCEFFVNYRLIFRWQHAKLPPEKELEPMAKEETGKDPLPEGGEA